MFARDLHLEITLSAKEKGAKGDLAALELFELTLHGDDRLLQATNLVLHRLEHVLLERVPIAHG